MNIKSKHEIILDFTAFKHNEYNIKTHNCELGEWCGNNTCSTVDLEQEISKQLLPDKEYKIKVFIETVE